jgi:RNA polymerase sigma-70 factor, ECF subfamily
MLEQTDKQLLDAFVTGDSIAFELLFNRHYQRVHRAAYGLGGSHALAEDAAQEAFVALYRRPPVLEAEASLIGWLCRVASNRAMNMLRGERREQARLERMPVEEEPDPADSVLRAEDRREVRAALAQLQDRQIQILVLRYAGLSYAEIAATVGVAAGSVGTLLARAERALVQVLSNTSQSAVVAESPIADSR